MAALAAAVSLFGCAAGVDLGRIGPQAKTTKEHLRLEELTPPATQPVNAPAEALAAEVEKAVTEAEARMGRGDFQGAIGLLQEAAGQVPDNARIAKDLGLASLGLGQRAKALEYLRQANKTAGDDVLLQLLLGQLQAAAGQTDEALLAFRRALRCTGAEPKDGQTAEVMLGLADLLARAGYLTAAEECYAQLGDAIDRHGRDYTARPRLRPLVVQPGRLLARRGELLSQLGRHDEARQLLEQAYARDRTDMQTAELLLGAHLAAKDFVAAERVLLDLAAEPTAQGQLPKLAAKLCQAAKDPALPARLWQAGRQSAVDAGALAVALAKAARELHADADAKEILRSALESRPNDVAVGCFVAEDSARSGDAAGAMWQLAALLAANDEGVDAVADVLDKMVGEKLLPERLEEQVAREAAADTAGLKGALHYLAGMLAETRGQVALAAEQYQASVDDDGRFLPAYEAAADLHLEAGRFDRVDRLIERLKDLAKFDADVRYYALYLAGKNDLAQGRLVEAAKALEGSREEYDGFAPALDLLAEAYGRLGRAEQAIGTLEELFRLDPEDEGTARRLFDLCLVMGRGDEARAVAGTLLRARPDSRDGQAMLVELLLATGKAEEGARVLEELRRQAGDEPAVRLLAVRLAAGSAAGAISRRQFDAWRAEIGEVLLARPDSVPARRLLAELLARTAQHTQAAAVLSELYAESPGLVDVAKAYVLELLQTRDLVSAQAVLEGNPYLQKDLQAKQWLLEVLADRGQLAATERYLREWLAGSTDSKFQDFCRVRLLDAYEKMRDFAAAQRQIDELIAANPPREAMVRLQAERVKVLCLDGRAAEAVKLIRAWTRQDEGLVLKVTLVGALSEGGCYGEAQDLLDGWIRRGEEGQEALAESKMLLFAKAGRVETAMRYAEAWTARCPGALGPRQTAVAVLVDAGQEERALALVDGWLVRTGAGGWRTRPASDEVALAQLEDTVATTEAAAQETSGKAVRATSRSTSSASTSAGSAPVKAGKPAPERLGALPVAKPADAEGMAAIRGWCRETAPSLLMATGQAAAALERAEQYLQDEPENVRILTTRSNALGELGRWEEAIATLEQAHGLADGDVGICNNLSYLYAEAGVHLDKAEVLIRQALSERGDQKDFLDTLGWVLYKQGRLPAAAMLFDRLLEGGKASWPSCAVSYDHAGDVYYRLGWTDRAAELWAQAVAYGRRQGSPGRDVRKVLTDCPGKIQAVQTGLEPAISPLGAGVKDAQEP